MAAYRKIPATGNVDLDRVNKAVYEALLAIAPPAADFQSVTVAKDYAASGSEGVIHVDASAGPVRVTLPAPSTTMAPLVVKQVNLSKSPRATFGRVTVVSADGASAIAGANSFALDDSGTGSVTFTSDGQQHWPGAAAGGNPSVNPAPPPAPPYTPPPSVTFVPLTRVINTVSPLFGGGALSSDLTLSLQQSATTLLGNPNATGGNTVEVSLGPGLGFVNFGGGLVLTNTSPLSGLSAVFPLNLAANVLTAAGVLYTNGGPGAVNLGSLASGILQQSVSAGVSTPSVFTSGTSRVPFGAGGGLLTDSANLVFSGSKLSLGQATFDATAHVVLTDDTTPGTIASWDARHAAFGASGSTGAGLGVSHTASTSTANLSAVLPNVAWENLRVQGLTFGLYSSGTTLGLFQDSIGNVAATNALGVNGASIAANTSLAVGRVTNANRDRVQFLLGGGVLGATGTGDNTLFDVNPSATVITAGVTAGVYATQRIRQITYSGAGTSPAEVASLYIDGSPIVGGGISTAAWALHVAAGTGVGSVRFEGSIRNDSLSAGGIVASDPAASGTLRIAGTGGLPAAVAGEQHYYINVAGSTLITGGAVWLGTSSTAGQGGTALEYEHNFAAKNVALKVHIITNAITSGTMAVQITRNGSSFSTLTLNSASSGTPNTGTISVGSPLIGDQWGVLVSGAGTGMSGNMVFTATLLLSPNVF